MSDIKNNLKELKTNSVSPSQIKIIYSEMELKVSFDEFNEQMKDKASKSSVTSALHRKANKNDIELALSQKVDSNTLSTIELNLSNKLDIDHFESALNKVYEGRVERVELKSLKDVIGLKCDKVVFDQLLKDHNQLHGDIQSKHGNLINNVEDLE